MDEARHCDRIGFMKSGRLIAEGEPDVIMETSGTNSLENKLCVSEVFKGG